MTSRLIPFAPEHLECMTVKADAREKIKVAGFADALKSLGSKTLVTGDGVVLGVLGFTPTLPGVCEVFILASEDQKHHPVAFAKTVWDEMRALKARYRRVQAVTTDDKFHERWITWLGFEREGTLKKYGLDGEDMVMWGMT